MAALIAWRAKPTNANLTIAAALVSLAAGAIGSTNDFALPWNVKRAVDLLERTATSWSREQLVAELRVRLVHVAAAHLAQGELDAADDILRTAMDRVAVEGYSEPLWHAVQHLATLRALRGHVHSAARLAGFVEKRGAQNDRVPDIFGRSSLKILENLVRQELSAPVAAALIAEGSAIRLDQALEEALA
jgi:hypothetical protein